MRQWRYWLTLRNIMTHRNSFPVDTVSTCVCCRLHAGRRVTLSRNARPFVRPTSNDNISQSRFSPTDAPRCNINDLFSLAPVLSPKIFLVSYYTAVWGRLTYSSLFGGGSEKQVTGAVFGSSKCAVVRRSNGVLWVCVCVCVWYKMTPDNVVIPPLG